MRPGFLFKKKIMERHFFDNLSVFQGGFEYRVGRGWHFTDDDGSTRLGMIVKIDKEAAKKEGPKKRGMDPVTVFIHFHEMFDVTALKSLPRQCRNIRAAVDVTLPFQVSPPHHLHVHVKNLCVFVCVCV